jgi:large subunit ribosomal protein L33
MAKKGEARDVIWLACDECKSRNYHTEKNKKNDPDRLGLSKFCRKCRSYKPHKEVR